MGFVLFVLFILLVAVGAVFLLVFGAQLDRLITRQCTLGKRSRIRVKNAVILSLVILIAVRSFLPMKPALLRI